jgi:hypothetical protein
MSVRTQMKRFGALAIQIRDRKELSDVQLDYLAEVFEKISQGCPADIALALRHKTGQSESKEVSVEERAVIIHWMYCAQRSIKENGLGLDLDQAIIAVMHLSEGKWINPINGRLLSYSDKQGSLVPQFKKYTYQTIEKAWYARENNRFKTLDLSALELGVPYDIKK